MYKRQVYGFGHAVYTVSDPRAEVLRACCMEVAKEQDHMKELDYYMRFERIAKEVMEEVKGLSLIHISFFVKYIRPEVKGNGIII